MSEAQIGDSLTPEFTPDGVIGRMTLGRTGRIFGGQIASHLVVAAAHEVDTATYLPQSIHISFLAPGDGAQPVVYRSRILKRGRAFWSVGVDATQAEQVIATAIVSFHVVESSREHEVPVTGLPRVDACHELTLDEIGGPSPVWEPLSARVISVEPDAREPRIRLWLKWRDDLGEDPVRQAAALCWISDLLMIRTMALREPAPFLTRTVSSLDHTLWFHRPLHCDEWFIVDVTSPIRTGARSLAHARVYDGTGRHTTSVAQEGLVR